MVVKPGLGLGPVQVLISLSSKLWLSLVQTIGNSFGKSFGPCQLSPESFRAIASREHTFPGGDRGGAGVQFRFHLV